MDGTINQESILRGRIRTIPVIDDTLTKAGAAADAQAVGEALEKLQKQQNDYDPHTAGNVGYDNADSGLTAKNLQAAVDEIAGDYLNKNGGGQIASGEDTPLSIRHADGDGAYLGLYGNGKLLGYIGASGVDTLSFRDTAGNEYTVHHAGNKPRGSYVGNGSADARTIDVGGIGDLIYVIGNTYTSLVSVHGAIVFKSNADGITHLLNSEIEFYNGVLTIKSDNIMINSDGVTYTYHVL